MTSEAPIITHVTSTAILEKPVRQYAGQLDAQLLVKWVATVKLLSRIPF
jgi:hypothetical protein